MRKGKASCISTNNSQALDWLTKTPFMKQLHPTPPFRYTLLQKFSDIAITLRGLWLLLLFNALAVFAFLLAPQGTDVLLSITEDAANHFHVGPLLWLLVSLVFWSIASEFSTRFLIYLTDNSGRSLAPARVNFRKSVQKWLSRIFLFFPSVLMTIAFLIAWRINKTELRSARYVEGTNMQLAFAIIIVILFLLVASLYLLYVRNGIVRFSLRHPRFTWLSISPKESEWAKKLYGILNDVRVDIPSNLSSAYTHDLPRQVPLPNGAIIPYAFKAYESNPVIEGNLHVWLFRIPLSFYRCLGRQLLFLFILAALFILVFAFLPPTSYMYFGAAALICLAFGCWQVVFVVIYLLDKAQKIFPVRFFLLLLFIISSFYNRDHPVRVLGKDPTRPQPLVQHFDQWLTALRQDSFILQDKDRVYRTGTSRDTIPVVFVAAEGGALRTGAFTSMILAKLSDSFPSFPKHIYCYSGVSGGTLGSNIFNALYLDRQASLDSFSYAIATEDFYQHDFLAAATGKLVFGEIINYFIPWHIPRFDRAIALEEAWEGAWANGKMNRLESSFNYTAGGRMPALFINTTEAESGLQCIWSNVGLDTITLGRQRDLASRTKTDLAYSTAINLSTRFPLVSPGATIFYEEGNRKERKHFVDGGYFENTGAETLLEVMKLLPLQQRAVKPYVIQFHFADEDSIIESSSITRFSEIMEIIGAIYNTRSGRSNLSQSYLQRYVDSLGGTFISLNLPLNTKQFPMSWTLSQTAMRRLNRVIDDMVKLKTGDTTFLSDKRKLRKLFVYDQ